MNKPYYITAYGLAVKRGFKGSMDEWLESLHGYVHIKYSEDMPAADSDMQDEPADWMGIYTGDKAEASTNYKDYKWHYVKGVANAAVIAPAFSAAKQYKSGDIVSYGDRVLMSRRSCSGNFNPADWQETTLAEALTEYGLPDGSVTGAKIASDGVNGVGTNNINDEAVTWAKIKNRAVTGQKLALGSIAEGHLTDGAVTGEKIVSDGAHGVGHDNINERAVYGTKIGLQAIQEGHIYDGAVTTNKIKDGAVTGPKMNLSNGDLGKIKLKSGTHYFSSINDVPADMKAAGMLVFVKAAD